MPKTLLIICLICLLTPITVLAGNGTSSIYGTVYSDSTPLPDTLITAIGMATYTSRTTKTNAKGLYNIEGLPSDEYVMKVIPQPEGIFTDGNANIMLHKGSRKEANFSLKKR